MCTDIHLKALKTTRNRHQDTQLLERDSNTEPPEHKGRVLTIVPQYSVRWASQDLHYTEIIRCGEPHVEILPSTGLGKILYRDYRLHLAPGVIY